MSEQRKIVLDRIKGVEFFPETPVLPNLHALFFLPRGLHILATSMRNQENMGIRAYRDELGIDVDSIVTGFLAGKCDHAYCACVFHWFSVSLINYLMLVALVDFVSSHGLGRADLEDEGVKRKIAKHTKRYCKSVCPDIVKWRNKIGAHMAIASPFPADNMGTLTMSAMSNVTQDRKRIYSGTWSWSHKNQNADIPRWSVTEVFEDLSERFWPNAKLPEYES